MSVNQEPDWAQKAAEEIEEEAFRSQYEQYSREAFRNLIANIIRARYQEWLQKGGPDEVIEIDEEGKVTSGKHLLPVEGGSSPAAAAVPAGFTVDDESEIEMPNRGRCKIQIHFEEKGFRVRIVKGKWRSWWEYFEHA